MLTRKEWDKINSDTLETVCAQTYHLLNGEEWKGDVLYCGCGAIIGDRNYAIKKGYALWKRVKAALRKE